MRVLYLGNQGGLDTSRFFAEIAGKLQERGWPKGKVLTWTSDEAAILEEESGHCVAAQSFEQFVSARILEQCEEQVDFEFNNLNWSSIWSVERSFCDYSMLQGYTGHRVESRAYVERLTLRAANFVAAALDHCDALVCHKPDTLLTYLALELAKNRTIPTRVICPAWILPSGESGGYWAHDEITLAPKLKRIYWARNDVLDVSSQRERAKVMRQALLDFGGASSWHELAPGRVHGRALISPKVRKFSGYLREQRALNEDVVYTKIDPVLKLRATMTRLVRRMTAVGSLQTIRSDSIPERSIYFPLHMQPEYSTLVQGMWTNNQIALIENLSRSMPLGYTLIVKEHPAARGRRPRSQYSYIRRMPNVELCDASTNEILDRVQACVVISGTTGLEALARGIPVMMVGRSFYEEAVGVTRRDSPGDFHSGLQETLRMCPKSDDIRENLLRFLSAYDSILVRAFPLSPFGDEWASGLEMSLSSSAEDSM